MFVLFALDEGFKRKDQLHSLPPSSSAAVVSSLKAIVASDFLLVGAGVVAKLPANECKLPYKI